MKTFDPGAYWDRRYREGRDSGAGSRGETGRAKAEHVNAVIAREDVRSVIDWGCGDGQVLAHITSNIDYVGVDVSPTILESVSRQHPGRRFYLDDAPGVVCDLALSMDVLFHFPEDGPYLAYLDRLFRSAGRLVLIYATDHDGGQTARHVRWRHWTPDVAARFPDWQLAELHPDPTQPGFYLYRRTVL